jgi:putative hemolysin
LFPKSVAIQFPERLAMGVVIPMQISQFLFAPLIWFFNGSGRFVLRLMGKEMMGEGAHAHSPEEIELLVTESHQNEMLSDESRRMLRNAFRLRELTARQVMLHRTKMVAVPDTSTVQEVLELSLEHGFSRIPVYRASIDDVNGFVHVKDVFRLHVQGEREIQSVVRQPLYVPETMPVVDVWEKLNKGEQYVAIVFDEYGGTAGLLTFEDLIEEVFGELQDEFDDEMALISRDKNGRVYLRGDLLVTDVNEYLELNLPEDHDTLSGLVLSELGRRAKIGDEVSVGNTSLRVEALADPGVSEVSITLPPKEESEDSFIEWEVIDHD